MPSLTYCLFQNTLSDLLNCYNAICQIQDLSELTKDEQKAVRRVIDICHQIVTASEGL